MSEKIIAMAFARLREAGKVSNIHWDDIVAHDPTGRLASLRGWRARKLWTAQRAGAGLPAVHAARFMIFSMLASSFAAAPERWLILREKAARHLCGNINRHKSGNHRHQITDRAKHIGGTQRIV